MGVFFSNSGVSRISQKGGRKGGKGKGGQAYATRVAVQLENTTNPKGATPLNTPLFSYCHS